MSTSDRTLSEGFSLTLSQPKEEPMVLYISERGIVACPRHGGEYLRAAVAVSPGRFNYLTPLDHWQKLPRDAARLYDVRCKECENR